MRSAERKLTRMGANDAEWIEKSTGQQEGTTNRTLAGSNVQVQKPNDIVYVRGESGY